jgi:hypothetical protein
MSMPCRIARVFLTIPIAVMALACERKTTSCRPIMPLHSDSQRVKQSGSAPTTSVANDPVLVARNDKLARTEANAVTHMMRRHSTVRVARDTDGNAKAIVIPSDGRVRSVLRGMPILPHVEEVDVTGAPLYEEDL